MTKDLNAKVKTYWTNRGKNAHVGLVMAHECIEHLARHRDWTPLSRFMTLAGADKPKIALLVRAAFGDAVSYKVDKNHETGGRFTLNFEGEFPLHGRNAYGYVEEAIAQHKGYNSLDFLKKLREAVGQKDAAKAKEYLDHLTNTLKYLEKRVKDVPALADILTPTIRDMKLDMARRQAAVEPAF